MAFEFFGCEIPARQMEGGQREGGERGRESQAKHEGENKASRGLPLGGRLGLPLVSNNLDGDG